MDTNPTDERKMVLEMVADGKITVDDAQRLLDRLQEVERQRPDNGGASVAAKPRPKYVRIVSTGEDPDDGLNLRIPIALVRAGLALDSFLPKWARSRFVVGTTLSDLTVLDSEFLRENLDDLDMTVGSEDGESIRLFVE